jgi:hypothetical protein
MKTQLLLYQAIQGVTPVAFLITGAVELSGGVSVQWLSLELEKIISVSRLIMSLVSRLISLCPKEIA